MSEESYTYHDEASAGYHFSKYSSSTSVCEIEEESPSETFEINHGVPMASIREEFEAGSLFSVDVQNSEDSVYVGVGKSDSSMDALAWTLNHAVTPSTIVYLVHVFPEIRYIPSPCKLSLSLSLSLRLVSHGQIGALTTRAMASLGLNHL
jgi:hypothetical protein